MKERTFRRKPTLVKMVEFIPDEVMGINGLEIVPNPDPRWPGSYVMVTEENGDRTILYSGDFIGHTTEVNGTQYLMVTIAERLNAMFEEVEDVAVA